MIALKCFSVFPLYINDSSTVYVHAGVLIVNVLEFCGSKVTWAFFLSKKGQREREDLKTLHLSHRMKGISLPG